MHELKRIIFIFLLAAISFIALVAGSDPGIALQVRNALSRSPWLRSVCFSCIKRNVAKPNGVASSWRSRGENMSREKSACKSTIHF